jgi:hypothetical protein
MNHRKNDQNNKIEFEIGFQVIVRKKLFFGRPIKDNSNQGKENSHQMDIAGIKKQLAAEFNPKDNAQVDEPKRVNIDIFLKGIHEMEG